MTWTGHWEKVGEQTLIQIFNGQTSKLVWKNYEGQGTLSTVHAHVKGLVFSPNITCLEYPLQLTTLMLFRVSFHAGSSPTKF